MRPTTLLGMVILFLGAHVLRSQTVLDLWPGPPPSGGGHEVDTTTGTSDLIAGRRVERLTGVAHPTLTVYAPASSRRGGAAVIVMPGGGYRILAYDLEGTEVCQWLNSVGVTCLLLKYRVPDAGPYPKHSEDLADAQRAIRLARQHAAEWQIDFKRIGVLGFSAGGHLGAVLSNHASEVVYPPADGADQLSAKPDFAILIYPGGLVHPPELSAIGPEVMPSPETPPTFLVQAEDDPVHVENTTAYYAALKNANVRAEMHIFAQGGHGYGLRHTAMAVTDWPALAARWMQTIGVLKGGAER